MDIYQYPSHFGHVGAYESPLRSAWLHRDSLKPSCTAHGSIGTLRNCPALCMASPELSETALHSAWHYRGSPKPSCTAYDDHKNSLRKEFNAKKKAAEAALFTNVDRHLLYPNGML